jgi:hypothetical protein
MRFAPQMLRCCIEFGDSLSAQREKQQRRFASATPEKAEKATSMSACGLIATVRGAQRHSRGLAVRIPLMIFSRPY